MAEILKERLKEQLTEIWDDYDFVVGVSAYLKNDEDRQAMLDYLHTSKEHDTSQITLVALNLYRAREDNIIIDDFYLWMKDVVVKE